MNGFSHRHRSTPTPDGQPTGASRVLGHAWAYELLQIAVGSHRSHESFVTEYVRPRPGNRILDLGCGPGNILRALPATVDYVGVDSSEVYIEAAKARWSDRGAFCAADGREPLAFDLPFDIVLAMGVLHHLDDAGCSRLLANTVSVLAPMGRLVTIDPARSDRQGKVAAWVIARDRGHHVRTVDGYAELARGSFGAVAMDLRTDLLRVPYTHAVLSCSRPMRR
jgi:2-polyprenyl-3-methyl-5-hydroxy-6-metoxy-1,4-benzoquinol methylase